MRKVNKFSYDVRRGEEITITVVPKDFLDELPSVEATLDDEEEGEQKLVNIGTVNKPTFTFTVKKPFDATHRVFMEFTFLPDTPDEACYDVKISGQNDIGCPCGFQLCKRNETRELTVAFDVLLGN
jgi:hypothetical protein